MIFLGKNANVDDALRTFYLPSSAMMSLVVKNLMKEQKVDFPRHRDYVSRNLPFNLATLPARARLF